MNLLECAVYNEYKSGQAVAHWIRLCKENSIDVLDEFCSQNKERVRTSHTLILFQQYISVNFVNCASEKKLFCIF